MSPSPPHTGWYTLLWKLQSQEREHDALTGSEGLSIIKLTKILCEDNMYILSVSAWRSSLDKSENTITGCK